jgi:predicted nucleic acid-binding Zn ribbon protein
VGIVFKGSGWYITDSRKSDSASIGGDGSSKSEKSETSGSES